MDNAAKIAAGAIVDFVTILAYLSIPPTEAVDMTFALLRFGLPVIASIGGGFVGWGIRGVLADRRQADIDELEAEVAKLRSDYANERAYTAALLVKIPPGERMTREQVASMVESATGYDDEADAAKLGAEPGAIAWLDPAPRRVLYEMTDIEALVFRELCGRCVTLYFDDKSALTVLMAVPAEDYSYTVARTFEQAAIFEGFEIFRDDIRPVMAGVNGFNVPIVGEGGKWFSMKCTVLAAYGHMLGGIAGLSAGEGTVTELSDRLEEQGYELDVDAVLGEDGEPRYIELPWVENLNWKASGGESKLHVGDRVTVRMPEGDAPPTP